MNAQERLRRLRSIGVHKGTAALLPAHRSSRGPAIEDLVTGELLETPFGRCFVSEQRFAADYDHGVTRLTALPSRDPGLASRVIRDPRLADLDFGRAAFIDTETTGLAGGTGTIAFLVGIGYYDAGEFWVRQYFMRDFHEEAAMLTLLAAWFDRFSGLVTFNGKAFDMPLLTTRFITARMKPRLHNVPHWDLLFASRRLWRERIGSCALPSLEKQVLGLWRSQADVGGGLIPQLYFDYLRSGDAREMARVFYHNATDVASMAALATHILDLLEDPELGAARHASDLCSLGRLYEEAGMLDSAERCFSRALACPKAHGKREAALRHLGLLRKRLGDHDAAREIWRALADEGREAKALALVELAKLHEHRLRDYEGALGYTAQALDEVAAWPPGRERRRALKELQHRQERLRGKLARARRPDQQQPEG